jgi:hypothetical protein
LALYPLYYILMGLDCYLKRLGILDGIEDLLDVFEDDPA